MAIISIRISDELNDKAEALAKKNGKPLAKYLRQIIEDGLAAAAAENSKEQGSQISNNLSLQTADAIDAEKKPELLLEYKKNLQYFAIEVSALLHAIIKDSGKFTSEEAAKLELKAQHQTNLYLRHYEKEKTKESVA